MRKYSPTMWRTWSRNPMYLSLTIICAGIALAMGKAWPLVLVVLPWAAMTEP
jgi:protein-S-isoprenylcysteine O-methyltransferase Ste14